MSFNKVFDFWNKSIDHNKNVIWDNKYLNLKFDSVRNQLKYRSKSFNDPKEFICQFNSNTVFIFILFSGCDDDIFEKFFVLV
jgi:hypothetical protein